MSSTLFWPYAVGLVPILFARTWTARWFALFFAVVVVGIGTWHFSMVLAATTPPSSRTAMAPVIAGLFTAFLSAVVTYWVDGKEWQKNSKPA